MATGGQISMRKPRRNHSAAFKARVALEAIRGEKTVVFRHILLDPTHDSRVGDDDLTLSHHLGQIAVAQPISDVPANAEFDGFS